MVYDLETVCHPLTAINAHCTFDTFSNKRDEVTTVANAIGPSSLSEIHRIACTWCSTNSLPHIHAQCTNLALHYCESFKNRFQYRPRLAPAVSHIPTTADTPTRGRGNNMDTSKSPPRLPPPPAPSPSSSSSSSHQHPSHTLMRSPIVLDARRNIRHIAFAVVAIIMCLSAVVHCDHRPDIGTTASILTTTTTTMTTIKSEQFSNHTISLSTLPSQPLHISSIDSKRNESNVGAGVPTTDRLLAQHNTNQPIDNKSIDISISKHSESNKSISSSNGWVDGGGDVTDVANHGANQRLIVKRVHKYQYAVDATNRSILLVPFPADRQLLSMVPESRNVHAFSPLKRLIYVLTSVQPDHGTAFKQYRSSSIEFVWKYWISVLMRNATISPSSHDHYAEIVLDRVDGNNSTSLLHAIIQNKIILWNFTKNLELFLDRIAIDGGRGPEQREPQTDIVPAALSPNHRIVTRRLSNGRTPNVLVTGNITDTLADTTSKYNVKISSNPMGTKPVRFARIMSLCLNCTYRIRPPVEIIILPKSANNRWPQLQNQQQSSNDAMVAASSQWPPLHVRMASVHHSPNVSLNVAATEPAHESNMSRNLYDSVRLIAETNRSNSAFTLAHTNALFDILRRSAASISDVKLKQSITKTEQFSHLHGIDHNNAMQQDRASNVNQIQSSNLDNYNYTDGVNNDYNNHIQYAAKAMDNSNFLNSYVNNANGMTDTKRKGTYDFSNDQTTKSDYNNNSIDNKFTTYDDESNNIDDNDNNNEDTNKDMNDNYTISVISRHNANTSTNINSNQFPFANVRKQLLNRVNASGARWTQQSKQMSPENTNGDRSVSNADTQQQWNDSHAPKTKRIAEAASANKPRSLNSHLMRLESIKYQILMKLGLKQKPNITRTLSRHVVMSAISRADGTDTAPNIINKFDERPYPYQHPSSIFVVLFFLYTC